MPKVYTHTHTYFDLFKSNFASKQKWVVHFGFLCRFDISVGFGSEQIKYCIGRKKTLLSGQKIAIELKRDARKKICTEFHTNTMEMFLSFSCSLPASFTHRYRAYCQIKAQLYTIPFRFKNTLRVDTTWQRTILVFSHSCRNSFF